MVVIDFSADRTVFAFFIVGSQGEVDYFETTRAFDVYQWIHISSTASNTAV